MSRQVHCRRPGKLRGDKACHSAGHPAWLRKRRINPRIARPGIESSGQLGRHRWKIERSLAWLSGHRRLTARYERKGSHVLAFLGVADALTCYRESAHSPCETSSQARGTGRTRHKTRVRRLLGDVWHLTAAMCGQWRCLDGGSGSRGAEIRADKENCRATEVRGVWVHIPPSRREAGGFTSTHQAGAGCAGWDLARFACPGGITAPVLAGS